jgi:S1-C subfamily serine protease
MKRKALYSSSRRDISGRPMIGRLGARPPVAEEPALPPEPPSWFARRRTAFKAFYTRREKVFGLVASGVVAILALVLYTTLMPGARNYTQHDIDLAVRSTLEHIPEPPSAASRAYAVVRPSVVRVNQLEKEKDSDELVTKGVGTGVIIDDKGTILTNLHVVAGADKVGVEYMDGTKSEAEVISVQPENDLAVLKPATIPDDMVPATLKSTAKLRPGDEVIAVGNPFGIGVSVSDGIISGLRRNYQSADGKSNLTNLIQFDAAANPGNSGGPLVTTDGEVIGIVTAILNPTSQRVFIGIGFAVPIENAAAAVGLSPF